MSAGVFAPTSLAGRVVLVVGATGGIGGATSLQLARCGATLLLTGRNHERLRGLADQIEALGRAPDEVDVVSAELTEESASSALVAAAVARFGRLDAVVNASGAGRLSSFESVASSEWLKLVEVNLSATIRLLHAACPALRESRGRFVQVVSGLAHTARKGSAVYGATQHALEGLIRSLKIEYGGKGVSLSLVSVGGAGVDTAFWDQAMPRVDRHGMMSAGDVASNVAWVLLGPDAVQVDDLRLRQR